MVEIVQRKWEELDLEALTTLTRSVFNFEGRGEYSQEQIERHLTTLQERFPFEAVFIATRDETLVGWTGVERQTENIGEIGRWHPYVANIPERDEIAESLISERCSWLKSNNWALVEDTFYMNMDASAEIPEADIPDGFSLHPLLENDDDALYNCHYAAFTSSEAREFYGLSEDAFTSSEAREFYGLSEDEKRQHFDKLYDRTQSINADASFVLKKGDEIASMLLTISRENEEHFSVVAVHPSHRGKGLAKALLTAGIQKVREQEATYISIGVDVVNKPAVSLYRKYGFETRSRLSFHSWSETN